MYFVFSQHTQKFDNHGFEYPSPSWIISTPWRKMDMVHSFPTLPNTKVETCNIRHFSNTKKSIIIFFKHVHIHMQNTRQECKKHVYISVSQHRQIEERKRNICGENPLRSIFTLRVKEYFWQEKELWDKFLEICG